MAWQLSNQDAAGQLRTYFEKLGIDCTKPGFCDDPAFLALEQKNPRILERYAHLIETQTYSEEYLSDAERKIQAVADAMETALEADGNQSLCIQASGTIGRMLDHLGLWNYQAKSTLTINFATRHGIRPVYFWALDEGQFLSPHSIVVAPPFGVIDVSFRHQPYSKDVKRELLPRMVLSKDFQKTKYTADDLAIPELRLALKAHGIPFMQFLMSQRPQMVEVMDSLPTRTMKREDVSLKYVVIAVGGMEETLPGLTWKFAGRTPMQIFEQEVESKL